MDDLNNVRLRHSTLIALYQHMKTYLDCMQREYFGPRTAAEDKLCKEFAERIDCIERVLWQYYQRESELME